MIASVEVSTTFGVDVRALAQEVARKEVVAKHAAADLAEAKKALSERLRDTARQKLGNKLYGSASFEVPGVGKLKAEVKRTVRWDQVKLQEIAQGLDAAQFPLFFTYELKPNEDAYERLPDGEPLKDALTGARTTRYDEQPRVELVSLEEPA